MVSVRTTGGLCSKVYLTQPMLFFYSLHLLHLTPTSLDYDPLPSDSPSTEDGDDCKAPVLTQDIASSLEHHAQWWHYSNHCKHATKMSTCHFSQCFTNYAFKKPSLMQPPDWILHGTNHNAYSQKTKTYPALGTFRSGPLRGGFSCLDAHLHSSMCLFSAFFSRRPAFTWRLLLDGCIERISGSRSQRCWKRF
jgi:hypothetical protein